MLSDQELLVAVRKLSRSLAAVAILHHIAQPAKTGDITERGVAIGFRAIRDWNLTAVLNQAESQGLVRKTPAGWSTLPKGLERLKAEGLDFDSPMIVETRHALRKHVSGITDKERLRFLEEAIGCFDAKLWRAAVVFAWVGAAYILQEHIVANHLAAFNASGQALNRNGQSLYRDFKPVSSMKDFDVISEELASDLPGRRDIEQIREAGAHRQIEPSEQVRASKSYRRGRSCSGEPHRDSYPECIQSLLIKSVASRHSQC